jgi:hypothetical protein
MKLYVIISAIDGLTLNIFHFLSTFNKILEDIYYPYVVNDELKKFRLT